jgi:hypothetical protein
VVHEINHVIVNFGITCAKQLFSHEKVYPVAIQEGRDRLDVEDIRLYTKKDPKDPGPPYHFCRLAIQLEG